MNLEKNKTYTLVNQHANSSIEIEFSNQTENWLSGKVNTIALSKDLQVLFEDIERSIKNNDFQQVKALENQLHNQAFTIKETNESVKDLQLVGLKTVYFKLNGEDL